MINLYLDKSVTMSIPMSKVMNKMVTFRYKDLSTHLQNVNQFVAEYPCGDEKRRLSLLTKLGFKLDHYIFYNESKDQPWQPIKGVWKR